MDSRLYLGGVWLVDFEFHPLTGREGDTSQPVCLVAREYHSGRTLRIWQEELQTLRQAPFPVDDSALFVAYYASAEIGCFLALGWPLPRNILDLFCEFRTQTNGRDLQSGNSLLGALTYHGLGGINASEKDDMRNMVLRGSPWSESEQQDILDYCESDVTALAKLLPAMQDRIDWPRALLRGQYSVAAAHIEYNGIPLDMDTLNVLRENWENIKDKLIKAIDHDYGVYEGRSFRRSLFEKYLASQNIAWPCTHKGALMLDDDTFKSMATGYPQLHPLRELRLALGQMRLTSLHVGNDGRNRCMLSILRAKTGRNQPSNSHFVFGPSVWMRGLIQPRPGYGLAYVDWSQQEFGIAAALSGDAKMQAAYASGDPYLAFAKQAGAAPDNASKTTHGKVREQFKACVLAVQYGMGAESLALRIRQPVARARQLLELHKLTYRQFWKWSDDAVNQALLGGSLRSVFGWQILTDSNPNERSLRNFPMQANGAEMLRVACILLVDKGVRICAPVHDAILIEAPLETLDVVVAQTQETMQQASAIVLDGFVLKSDARIVRYPDRYMDERGIKMWNTVMDTVGLPDKKATKS